MTTLRISSRPSPCPPTEGETRLAIETGRRLGSTLERLSGEGDDSFETIRLVLEVPGKLASESMDVPASALRMLATILDEMGRGNAVTLTPIPPELTIRQAADLLGVSRSFLGNFIDTNQIDHCRVSGHRQVKFVDLMEYKQRTDEARSQVLDELAQQVQELDMGY